MSLGTIRLVEEGGVGLIGVFVRTDGTFSVYYSVLPPTVDPLTVLTDSHHSKTGTNEQTLLFVFPFIS